MRVDILERLADLIRPAIAYRPGETIGEPPAGAADGDGFVATVAMTSLVGCAGEDFATILKSLGLCLPVPYRPGHYRRDPASRGDDAGERETAHVRAYDREHGRARSRE